MTIRRGTYLSSRSPSPFAALRGRTAGRGFAGRAGLAAAVLLATASAVAAQALQTGPSGLPLPRFASTKSAPVNIRMGPSPDHEVAYTFVKPGIPVEITQEFDVWLRVRDSEGQEGWVKKTLLSGKRTALVAPWEKSGTTAVRDKPDIGAKIVATIEPGVRIDLSECSGRWCRLSVEGVSGWIEQGRIWGAYPDESFR